MRVKNCNVVRKSEFINKMSNGDNWQIISFLSKNSCLRKMNDLKIQLFLMESSNCVKQCPSQEKLPLLECSLSER